MPAGDIAAVAKLNDTSTGDILAQRGADISIEPFESPAPVLPMAIRPKSKADEDKLANALHRLQDEDPVLRVERNAETHQTLLWGIGETHLSIALEKLQRKYGVEVEQEDVKVAYRETVGTKAEAEGKYKKQTGGHGQFGVAFLRVEPLERGAGFEFSDAIVGGAIPRQFIPAVERGIADTIVHGGALGFPVVDVKVTCYDGKYHPVDSSEMSFKMAGSLGFKEAAAKARPVLLEPISELVITVPEAYQGDVMGDLNSKRGRIQGTAAVGNGEQEITRPGADLGGDPLRHRPPVPDRRPGPLHRHPLPLRPGPAQPGRQDRGRGGRGQGGLSAALGQRCGDPVDGGGDGLGEGRALVNGAKWSPSRVKVSASRASASSYCFSGRTSWSVVVTTTAQGTSTSGASGRPS